VSRFYSGMLSPRTVALAESISRLVCSYRVWFWRRGYETGTRRCAFVAWRGPVAEDADARRMQPDGCRPLRLGVRQRAEQQCVDNAEDRAVTPDADRQGKYSHGGEAEALTQHAHNGNPVAADSRRLLCGCVQCISRLAR